MTCEAMFATAATADRADAEIGVIWWLRGVDGYALGVADYALSEVAAINADWVEAFFRRSAELVAEHRPATRGCLLRVEHPGLVDLLKRADGAYSETGAAEQLDRSAYDIRPIKQGESAKWAATFDERVYAVRPLVDSKKVIRPATGLRRFTWHARYANHLAAQLHAHKPGAQASELVGAFVLGVLIGTTKKSACFFEAMARPQGGGSSGAPPSHGPFGPYVQGRRPL